MELDGEKVADRATLETDLCIVGAGPAGLVLAGELAKGRHDVVLLESGGHRPEPAILALNDGVVVGDEYAGLRQTRHRQLGGTSAIWNTPVQGAIGAKYAPLDAYDLDARPGREGSGWPVSYAELLPYYARAQQRCGLGPFAYEAESWSDPPVVPFRLAGSALVSRVYQLGSRDSLVAPILGTLRRESNVRSYTHATVVRLETGRSRTGVLRAVVGSPGGARWSVHAERFVLAAGAVENARLLLSSGEPPGLGNEAGWVGRCFMEHPRDGALFLHPRSPTLYEEAAFYDLRQARDGTAVLGRLALSGDVLRSDALLNASATLFPVLRPAARRARAALGPLARSRAGEHWLPRGGHGWLRHPAPARVFAGFTLLLNLEQSPHPENRVVLGPRRDALGVPMPELHWRWRPEDEARLQKLRAVVAHTLVESGLGRVETLRESRPNPNAHHHAGTTRMSANPAHGVVDANGRVHSLDNLFVAGASVFPTAGFANPTLTIVALTLRLADHMGRTT
ncbi:MAG: GMC family oxidoreductase [Gemmatimonadaceae bacterium]